VVAPVLCIDAWLTNNGTTGLAVNASALQMLHSSDYVSECYLAYHCATQESHSSLFFCSNWEQKHLVARDPRRVFVAWLGACWMPQEHADVLKAVTSKHLCAETSEESLDSRRRIIECFFLKYD
jgi:hypothetical protein